MKDPVISVNRVSKCFKVYEKPKHILIELLLRKKKHREIWALKDISFEVAPGEVWGIIGDNGSGKSTLLKIIAGVLTPTKGEVLKKGRVASLLELGTGFHPEFTGRENIYFNGALIGIPYKELKSKESEIIEFSELGEAIDRPIKSYSSGMVVRLAFSIATAVDPDVLIVDEALSVGDHYFQKKSFAKMMEFKRKGKTILFCSHSMYHVSHLCNKVIWLHQGELRMKGETERVIIAYENHCREKVKSSDASIAHEYPDKVEISLNKKVYRTGDKMVATIRFEGSSPPYHFVFGIKRNDGLTIYASGTHTSGLPPINSPKGEVIVEIERLPLLPGSYFFDAGIGDETGNVLMGADKKDFIVEGQDHFLGLVRIDHKWTIKV